MLRRRSSSARSGRSSATTRAVPAAAAPALRRGRRRPRARRRPRHAVLQASPPRPGRRSSTRSLARYRHPADPLEEQRHLDCLGSVRIRRLPARSSDVPHRGAQPGRALPHRGPCSPTGSTAQWPGSSSTGSGTSSWQRFPTNTIPRMLEGIAGLAAGRRERSTPLLVRRGAWRSAGHTVGGQRRLVEQSLERLEVNVRFVQRNRPMLAAVLAKRLTPARGVNLGDRGGDLRRRHPGRAAGQDVHRRHRPRVRAIGPLPSGSVPSSALVVQAGIAVVAGRRSSLLPHRVVELVVIDCSSAAASTCCSSRVREEVEGRVAAEEAKLLAAGERRRDATPGPAVRGTPLRPGRRSAPVMEGRRHDVRRRRPRGVRGHHPDPDRELDRPVQGCRCRSSSAPCAAFVASSPRSASRRPHDHPMVRPSRLVRQDLRRGVARLRHLAIVSARWLAEQLRSTA